MGKQRTWNPSTDRCPICKQSFADDYSTCKHTREQVGEYFRKREFKQSVDAEVNARFTDLRERVTKLEAAVKRLTERERSG